MRSEFYSYADFETGLEFIATGRIDESGEPKTTAGTTLLDQKTNAYLCRNAATFLEKYLKYKVYETVPEAEEELIRATMLGVRRQRSSNYPGEHLPEPLRMIDEGYVYVHINTLLGRAAELEALAEQNQAVLTAGH